MAANPPLPSKKRQSEKTSLPTRPSNPTPPQTLLSPPARARPHRRHLTPGLFTRNVSPKSGIHQFRWKTVGEDLADIDGSCVGGVEG